jgi:glycosyltransferase involved in cell wall biosynthesis
MDYKINILFILPSLSRAGAEIQTVNLINSLPASKYKKHLLSFEKNTSILNLIDQSTVTYHHIMRRSKFDLRLIKEVNRIIFINDIEIINCSMQISLLVGWLSTRFLSKMPLIVATIHTTIQRNYKLKIMDWILHQWLMRSCKKIICVCNNQKNHWERKFPVIKNLTQTIYNGVDVDFFNPENQRLPALKLKAQLGLPDDAFVLAHIAAFRPEKGHRILLEAFKLVATQNPKAFLVFAGDGILRPAIAEQVQSMGLKNQVRFLGSVADVRPLLGLADLSVIASTAVETFSIAMLESMSMEVPLVATDIGGTSEAVIPDITGFLVPPDNVTALSLAILSAMTDERRLKNFGVHARQNVIDHFSSQVMVDQTNKLFLDLMERY